MVAMFLRSPFFWPDRQNILNKKRVQKSYSHTYFLRNYAFAHNVRESDIGQPRLPNSISSTEES